MTLWFLASAALPKTSVDSLLVFLLIAAFSIGCGIAYWRNPRAGGDELTRALFSGLDPAHIHAGARRISAASMILLGLFFLVIVILSVVFEYLLD